MSTPKPQPPSTSQLRAEIAATRTAIDAGLTEIGERLSRERLREEAHRRFQEVALPAVAGAFVVGLVLGYTAAGRCCRRPRG